MRLVSYRHRGREAFGVIVDQGVVEAGPRLDDRFADLRAVLAAGALDELRRAAEGRTADVGLDQIEFRPVLPNPDKIVCVGINYEAHRIETGREKTQQPVLFMRWPDTQVGHGQPLVKPRHSDMFDYEGELALVIGTGGRHLAAEQGLAHVAGYACYNEGSVRDWQRHTSQFTPGKNFPGTGGFGPWLTTSDEIPDPTRLTLVTRLNGQEMQRTGTDDLIFGIPTLIAYISTFTRLGSGDVIVTGTPGGVGSRRTPPVWMRPGDVCEVEISGIGTLRNPIVGE